MNLDELISKYLDGELSNSEDKELRRLLSEDDVAKHTFDAYVLIHAAMKEDASAIRPSKELIGNTEDRILSRILSDKEEEDKPVVVPFFFRRRAFAFGGALAVLLLTSVLVISNLNWEFYSSNLDSALDKERQRIMLQSELELLGLSEGETSNPYEMYIAAPDEIMSDGATKKIESSLRIFSAGASVTREERNPIITTSSSDALSEDLSGNNGLNIANDNAAVIDAEQSRNDVNIKFTEDKDIVTINNPEDEINKLQTDKLKSPALTENESLSFMPALANRTSDINNYTNNTNSKDAKLDNGNELAVLKDEFANMKQMNSLMSSDITSTRDLLGQFHGSDRFYGAKSDVQLSTFLGSEIKKFGFEAENPTAISSYSQSIAYNITPTSKFGIDFGYTDYSYNETRIARVPNPSFHSADDGSRDVHQSRIEVRRDGDPMRYIEFPFEVSIQRQIVWGSGFFEQNIIDDRYFGLNGRLSLGATNDGLMSMARLFGRVKLFDWLAINAGSEARLFRWDNRAISTGSSGYKSTISIIYGFEIKL